MGSSAVAMKQERENDILKEFLTLAARGLRDENRVLVDANSDIHNTAKSIYFAYCEQVYAYLIRRSLAVNRFPYQISYEHPYTSLPGQLDLRITIPRVGEDPEKFCGVEFKMVVDEKEGGVVSEVLRDVTKLLREPELQVRCVFLFPMFGKGRLFDVGRFCDHLKTYGETNPAWARFKYSVIDQQSFPVNGGEFCVALVRVFPL